MSLNKGPNLSKQQLRILSEHSNIALRINKRKKLSCYRDRIFCYSLGKTFLAKKSGRLKMILCVMLFGDSGLLTRKGTLILKWKLSSWCLKIKSQVDMRREMFLRALHFLGLELVSINSLTTNTTSPTCRTNKNKKFTAKSVINNVKQLNNYKLSKIKEIKAKLLPKQKSNTKAKKMKNWCQCFKTKNHPIT